MSWKRKTIILTVLIVSPILGETRLRSQVPGHQKNRPPSIESFAPSTFALYLCPFVSDHYIVKLNAIVSDPDGDLLTYSYVVTGGRIAGKGSSVDWDLRAALGKQKVIIEVTDSHGAKASSAVEISVELNTATCDPPCTSLTASGPPTASKGELVTFAASITGPLPETKRKFIWSGTNGEIVEGQGTDSVRVRVTGSSGAQLQMKVDVSGLDPACNREASAKSKIQED